MVERNAGLLFENMYFYCMNSVKTKILPMLGTGYFLKTAKKQQSVLMAKISLRKTQKIDNRQKVTTAKVSCHMVTL